MSDLKNLVDAIAAVPLRGGRRIIAIVGAPASGKSTLAERLSADIPNSCIVPMDGFHRDNDDLSRHDLLLRKGAPETFDVAGFLTIVRSLAKQGEVDFPTFDRGKDCVVEQGGKILATDETILVEGNYLLLDEAPWRDLAKCWDFNVFLDVPLEVLEARLVQRWLDNGYDHDGAVKRAQGNDVPNAKRTVQKSMKADHVVSLGGL